MKKPPVYIVIVLLILFYGCKKDTFITSKDAVINLSADTLHFDTVFTTAGSVTQFFKIVNGNNQKLEINNVTLAGGTTSAFKINVDGTTGPDVKNIELDANDSIFVFVTVTINPNATSLPFIMRDSIIISFNGNSQ